MNTAILLVMGFVLGVAAFTSALERVTAPSYTTRKGLSPRV
jgi:hypothetical protein